MKYVGWNNNYYSDPTSWQPTTCTWDVNAGFLGRRGNTVLKVLPYWKVLKMTVLTKAKLIFPLGNRVTAATLVPGCFQEQPGASSPGTGMPSIADWSLSIQ